MSDFDRQNTWLSLQPVTGVKYTDGTTQTSAEVEGTAVKSTGQNGGERFLREDGDGTCSWQHGVSEGADVLSTTNSNETLGKVLTADGDGTSSWTVVGSVASENRLAAWASYNSGDSTDSYSLEGYNVSSITHVSTGTTTINIDAAVISDVSRTVATGCAIAMNGAGWPGSGEAIDPHLDVYGGGDSIADFGAMVMTTTTCKVKTQNNDVNTGMDYGNVQVVIFGGA